MFEIKRRKGKTRVSNESVYVFIHSPFFGLLLCFRSCSGSGDIKVTLGTASWTLPQGDHIHPCMSVGIHLSFYCILRCHS